MTLAERLMEKGIKKGEIRKAREMAKTLLMDDVRIELVAKYTNLTIQEIIKIKSEIM